MYGSEDKYKKFNSDVADFLKKNQENQKENPVLSAEQVSAATSAKEELAEKHKNCPLMTLETRNSVIKKHMFASSKGVNITPRMANDFENIALGD